MERNKLAQTASILALTAGMALDAAPALAAPSPSAVASSAVSDQESAGLQDIVVTAQRRTESADKSAIAISVMTGDQLQRAQIVDTASLVDSVPGLELNSASPYKAIGLRGLSAGGTTQWNDPSIAFSIGGVPLGRLYATNGAYYDLERIEVLKGPQGTLYGRNATIGAINLLPKRPVLGSLEGDVGVTVGSYSALNVDGAINIPIGQNAAARVAFATNRHDGYLSNGLDDADNQALRVSLKYEPTDRVSALLWVDRYQDRSKGAGYVYSYILPNQRFLFPDNPWFAFGPAGCGNTQICPAFSDSAAPGGPPQVKPPFDTMSVVGSDAKQWVNQTIIAGEFNFKFDFATLTVIPAYVKTETDLIFYPAVRQTNKSDVDQKSLEVRLASSGSGFRWVAGAFYFNEQANSTQTTLQTFGFQVPYTPNLVAKSYAAFVDATLPVLPNLRVTGGLRYTHDEKSQDGYLLVTGSFQTANPAAAGYCPVNYPGVVYVPSNQPSTVNGILYPYGYCRLPNEGNPKFNDVSWKAGVEFDAGPSWLLYANARTGYKAGGFVAGVNNTYNPEKLTAFEIGSKARLFGGRLQLNVEGFYWDYKDQQIVLLRNISPAGQTGFPVNVPGYVWGAELETRAKVTRSDLLTATILYEKGKFDIYPTTVSFSGTIGGLTNFPRTNLPLWSGTVSYEHIFDLSSGGELSIGADMHFESGTNLRPVASPTVGDYRPAFATKNATITYHTANRKLSISAFVKNITNEAVLNVGGTGVSGPGTFYRPVTNPIDGRPLGIGAPRTYGASIRLNF